MNVHPIEQAALATAAPAGTAAAGTAARETLVLQCAALLRQLADAMLAHVQNTASLNLSAARALLAHAHIPTPANLQQRSDSWRQSWRSFEICATSADQMLQLTRGHVERTTAALWRTSEQLIDAMQQLDGARADAVRDAFDRTHAAQAACWRATQEVHHQLVALARAPLPRREEAGHGPH